ncbi:MAG: hypothetical protein R3E32_29460 [Chitinophagales bacterium]
MKIISIILAMFILGLTIRPSSNGFCCMTLQQENHQETNPHAHCSQTNHTDNKNDSNTKHDCNSSCSCICCNIHITIHQQIFINISPRILYNLSPTSHFTFQYSFEYFRPIWQPPQIG